jgi:hypothetical protein
MAYGKAGIKTEHSKVVPIGTKALKFSVKSPPFGEDLISSKGIKVPPIR